jgi:hypothetical protein
MKLDYIIDTEAVKRVILAYGISTSPGRSSYC